MTIRLASSTSSWKRRSSRFGAGNAMSVVTSVNGDRVEGEHQIAPIVGVFDLVLNIEIDHRTIRVVDDHAHALDVDARLPPAERTAHLVRERGIHRWGRFTEHEVAQSAAELWAHRTLAGIREQDDAHRFFEFALVSYERDTTRAVDARR